MAATRLTSREFKERADGPRRGGRTGLGAARSDCCRGRKRRSRERNGSRQSCNPGELLGFNFGLETLLHARKGASRCNSCIPFAEMWNWNNWGRAASFLGFVSADLHSGCGPHGTYQDSERYYGQQVEEWGACVLGSHAARHALASPAGALGPGSGSGIPILHLLTLALCRPELKFKIHRFG